VTAHLLGFTGVWVEMDDGANRAITRHDMLPSILTVAGGGRAVLARYQYEELMFFVAGLISEAKIAGYLPASVEEDTAGRPRIEWDAIRVARLEAGLPICGHKDCTIPFDADVDAGRVAEVIKRAEDEVFALLKANWPAVLRVVNALCRRDRITSAEFEALMAGPKRAGKRRQRRPEVARHGKANVHRGERVRNNGPSDESSRTPSMHTASLVGDSCPQRAPHRKSAPRTAQSSAVLGEVTTAIRLARAPLADVGLERDFEVSIPATLGGRPRIVDLGCTHLAVSGRVRSDWSWPGLPVCGWEGVDASRRAQHSVRCSRATGRMCVLPASLASG
jgi:hypothetical protein